MKLTSLNWKSTKGKQEGEVPKRELKTSVLRKNPDTGKLEMIFASKKASEKLSHINAAKYFESVLNGTAHLGDEQQTKAFYKALNQTECFHCNDLGIISIELETDMGPRVYGYQCTCEMKKEKPVGGDMLCNILDLQRAGVFTPYCKLGGDEGQYCKLKVKDAKCHQFNCTKFK